MSSNTADKASIESPSVGHDSQDQVLLSIRTIEAIREFAKDIVPLRVDGSNLRAWVCELDEILVDLLDCEKYLQGGRPASLNKFQDRVARRLIYWTIPRELRPCLRDAHSAHDAYEALSAQFLQNNRTSHMAAIVELFNFQMEITEAKDVGKLYNEMYDRFQELVHNGFSITQDALLGALFQIAIGRSNFDVYTEVSRFLDVKAANGSTTVTSQEVAAVARMKFDIMQKSMSAVDDNALGSPAASGATEPFQLKAIEPAPLSGLAGSASSTARPSSEYTQQSLQTPSQPFEQPHTAQAAFQPGSSLPIQPRPQRPTVSLPNTAQTPVAPLVFPPLATFAPLLPAAPAPSAPNPPISPFDAPTEQAQRPPATPTPPTPTASTSTSKPAPAKPVQPVGTSRTPAKPVQPVALSAKPTNEQPIDDSIMARYTKELNAAAEQPAENSMAHHAKERRRK